MSFGASEFERERRRERDGGREREEIAVYGLRGVVCTRPYTNTQTPKNTHTLYFFNKLIYSVDGIYLRTQHNISMS